jgi:hypothetical protein
MQMIRTSFVLFLSSLLLASCYTPSSLVTKKFSEPSKPLNNYLVLYAVLHEELQDMGEDNYNTYLKGKFNNLQEKSFRDNLVDKYIDLAESGTVWDYRNIFEDFKAYEYQAFQELLDKNGIDLILLVTEKLFIQREQIANLKQHQVYLFERGVNTPIWVSFGYQGSFPGKLAKGVIKDLKKEGFLQ